MNVVRTTCPYCGVGCGIKAERQGARTALVKGDAGHPANRGKLCSKGTHLGETLGLEGRLLHPMIGERRAEWPEALDLVAERFAQSIAEHGPDSVAFYVSGQLLTEDYYAANKLMKGFLGSANIDTNSRLCMASAVAAHNEAFGEDLVPACYDDLDEADLIVLVGSNTAWCHPVIWQRIEAARARRGTRLVVIDPRRTETAEGADLFLPLRPNSDIALFNGLLAYCADRGAVDRESTARRLKADPEFWDRVAEQDFAKTAAICDLPAADLQAFFDMFAATPRTVTLFSQGVNQSTHGTDKAKAILNLHLATGRIGRPGAAPFSITGQPNAMGGREVGGLASTLAAHMDFAPANVDRVRRFWNAPAIACQPGLKAVDLFKAVGEGKIKALWIMATNPAVSMPDAGKVREALAACPFVVVSDVIADTDTSRLAHVRLPACGWAEKDGTVTNSERRISRQRGFLAPPGEARPDWWMVTEIARRLGHGEAFAWNGPADLFREHCALTAFENDGARLLDLGALANMSDRDYDEMRPYQWGGPRIGFEDKKARLTSALQPHLVDHEMVLNTGRYRDQWHTMTRTGLSPRLSQHRREPLAEMHPADAAQAKLADGELMRISSDQGESIFRVAISDAQRRGEIFVPIHWTDQNCNGGRAGLLAGDAVDPVSGQPGFKLTPISIDKAASGWRAFLICRSAPTDLSSCGWWTKVRVEGGWLIELAGNGDPAGLDRLLPDGEVGEVRDEVRGSRRVAVTREGLLEAALFVARNGSLPPRDWLIAQLAGGEAGPSIRYLAGREPGKDTDDGPQICACFNIGLNRLLTEIDSQGLTNVAEIGSALGAGTNCGSCRPALARILATRDAAHAA